MIFIQFLIIISILSVLMVFLSGRSTSSTRAWKKILLIIFSLCAIITVLNPDLSTKVAHLVGVGRGADLLLYMLTIAFIFQVLSNYVKSKDEQKRVVKLARKIAIMEAIDNPHNI